MSVRQNLEVVLENGPFNEFLVGVSLPGSDGQRRKTHGHGELVIRKQDRHQTEKVLVVLSESYSLERDFGEDGLDRRWKLAPDVP